DIPSDLEDIISKCLQKKSADRFQHMSEIVQALSVAAGTAAPSPGDKSIVVLPFENISPDKDNEYFSDGLTEEVIADLSNIRTLRVISRSSAMTLKGTRKTVRTIGKELNVRYVLEGSVRKSGSRLRITAQLVDAATDAHLWAEKYSGTVDDIFEIQEKVSHSIAEALKLKLTTEEKAKLAEHPILNVQAYDAYLRARHAVHSWKEKELEQALELLKRALERVGENPLLYASLGYVYFQLVNAGYRQEDYIAKAEESAKKALALDPHSGHAHRLRGIIDSSFKGDQRSGYSHLKQVLASDPFDAESLYWLAVAYATYGKIEESRNFANRFLKIDPLNVISQLLHGWIHFQDGSFDNAVPPLEKAYQMEPAIPLHRFAFGLALAYSGRVQEAIRFIDVLVQLKPPTFLDRIILMTLYGLKGEKQLALEQVTEEVRTTAQRDFQWSWHLAAGYAANDEKEKALEWLENAVNLGFINYPMLAKYDPFLEGLRKEKRCQKLLERAKYEWEQFET
ncbi:MAG: tetratricopeptide repeat protein, partial [Limisphaerales bacterium]